MLNVALSEGERLEYGDQLARASNVHSEAVATKKTTSAQLGAAEKHAAAEVERLANIVNSKTKTTEVECGWTLNSPKKGKKVLVRLDTKVVIETRDMDAQDGQELFPDQVAELEKKPKGKKEPSEEDKPKEPQEGGEVREVQATVIPRLGYSGEAPPPMEKKKKGKKAKPAKEGGDVDWPAVKAYFIKQRQGDNPKQAINATALHFSLKANTVKARARREKWDQEAA